MKLLVVDDHPTLRAGLAALVGQLEAGTVVLEANDGDEALRVAQAHPDLDAVFVDLYLPGMDGLTLVQELARTYPQLPAIVMSSSEDHDDVRRALSCGALGYLPKSASPQTILATFRFVLSGNVYVPPLILEAIPARTESSNADLRAVGRLTERQLEVLRLLCDGCSNKEIARKLDLAEKTVKAHITTIFRQLDVVNRTQAVTVARQMRVVAEH